MIENKTDYILSTEKSKLDIPFIHDFLSRESYWSQGRSIETVQKSIENSLCYGIYYRGKQVAFGRIITDFAVFAWIADVFVAKEHKGKGLGKKLVRAMRENQELQGLRRWGLATKDAHTLYEQFGFHALEHPERFMEIVLENQ